MAARKRTQAAATGGYVVRASISGTRDGKDWPKPGERIDLPEVEASDYLAAGFIEKAVTDTTPKAPSTDADEGGASE
ncbi:hypothetical protein [Isoptericola aurantiacus]|uniref:hypothetical protein n=1 Tax=Isoptericola aurantiacus TaxID=3377839 RepID=UPI00383B3BDD